MTFIILHRWGKHERSSDPAALDGLLAELDASEVDDEHVSVAVRLASGPCVSAYVSGLVIYENVEGLAIDPRHIRVHSRSEALKLMVLLAEEKLDELERRAWRLGNGS